MAGKRILITGASGLIGSCLVRELLSKGAQVVAMGRSMARLEKIFGSQQDNLQFFEGNITRGLPENLTDIDIIFHAASPVSGREIANLPVDTISSNIDGARNCFEFLRLQKEQTGKNGRMVIFSSATVYGTEHDKEMIACENAPLSIGRLDSPASAYSESKRMTEVLASAYFRQYSIDIVTIRLSYVYGYSKQVPETAFYEFIMCACNDKDIVINSTRMVKRDNIYIDDAINGILLIAQNGVSGETYNISSGGHLGGYASASEIAEMIAQCANENYDKNVKVVYPNGICQQYPGTILDNTKASKVGFTVETPLSEGINRILREYITEESIK